MKRLTTFEVALCGILAALYATITITTASFAYGPIQFRIADALCVLPFFVPVTSVGLFIGCLIANLFSTVATIDIVIGSTATLIGCLITARLKDHRLILLPTIGSNTVLVGAMLAWVYTPESFLQGFLIMGMQVAVGEIAVMAVLGLPLAIALRNNNFISSLARKER